MDTFIKQIAPYVELHRCSKTGISWVTNGKTGSEHSAHPNIDRTGSVKGMKEQGYWKKNDRTVRTNGAIYNIDKLVATDDYDRIAANYCQCESCLHQE